MVSKICGTCKRFIDPPETSKGRADVGACPDFGLVNEKDWCQDWEPKEEEE